jgi:hypothetical protein
MDTCTIVVKALRFWEGRRQEPLGPMEKELLCAAAEHGGRISILRTSDREWVRIGNEDYWDTPQDPHRRVKALEARARLLDLGYSWYDENCETLTRKGVQTAKQLRAEHLAKHDQKSDG